MSVFTELANKGLHEVLGHPLCKTFLEMKWNIIRPNFIQVFVMYFFLAVFHTAFCYLVTDMKEHTWKAQILNDNSPPLTIDPKKIFEVGKPGISSRVTLDNLVPNAKKYWLFLPR